MGKRSIWMMAICLGLHAKAQPTLPKLFGTWVVDHAYILGSQVDTETLMLEYLTGFESYVSDELIWEWVIVNGYEGSGLSWPHRIAIDSGRVYYRPTGWDTTARVLYDFNLLVGDTAYIDWDQVAAIIEVADTMVVAGRPWRHLELSNEDEWIECMGSIHGLFRPCCYSYFENGFELQSFSGSYLDTDSTEFEIHWPFDQGVLESSRAGPRVYPNPTDGSFTITSSDAGGTYRVVDLRGSQIMSGSLRGSSTAVQLNLAMPGLYILEVNGQRTKLIIE